MRMHAACVHGHHVISAQYDATDVIPLSPRCTGWMMCHVLFTWESAAIIIWCTLLMLLSN